MRKLVAAALACGSLALADKPKKVFDVAAMADKLDAYRDDLGTYYLLPKPAEINSETEHWVFHGDSKLMYQQRVLAYAHVGKDYEWNVWAPRAKGQGGTGKLAVRDGAVVLDCRLKGDSRTLTAVTGEDATALLKHVKLAPPMWQRQAYLLARDDDGIYYYVDRVLDEFGGNGYRVYVGEKGKMKEAAVTTAATDTAGDLFVTKLGKLKRETKQDKLTWTRTGKPAIELTNVEVDRNLYLIYRDLGVYGGSLGAVCDFQ